MKSNYNMLFFFLSFFCFNLYSQETFQYTTIKSGVLNNETQINYFKDDLKIGFISYTKILCSHFYVLHSFYVYPEYRRQGYGEKLVKQACKHIKTLNASRIYIQPGPFEIIKGYVKNIHDQDYKTRIDALIRLYSKCDFIGVNTFTKKLAQLIYKIMKIDANADYLMVKEF